MIPPFIPEWKVQFDTKYFDEYEETKPFNPINIMKKIINIKKKLFALLILLINKKMIKTIELIK